MNTPHQPLPAPRRSGDLHQDMTNRWCPSVTQDTQAADALTRRIRNAARQLDTAEEEHTEQGVYTVQLLIGKRPGVWTPDVEVHALPYVYWTRQAALGACAGAATTHRQLRPDVPVTASYCQHHRLATPTDPAHTNDGRTWRTHWAIFEDTTPTPHESDAHST